MIKVTTKSGFTAEISEAALDDMELLDAVARLEDGDVYVLGGVCERLLGKEQRTRLYEHLRGKDGRVSSRAVAQTVTDILKGCGEGKNS